jgi:hypothetical protein
MYRHTHTVLHFGKEERFTFKKYNDNSESGLFTFFFCNAWVNGVWCLYKVHIHQVNMEQQQVAESMKILMKIQNTHHCTEHYG